jgi:hypothetical protein
VGWRVFKIQIREFTLSLLIKESLRSIHAIGVINAKHETIGQVMSFLPLTCVEGLEVGCLEGWAVGCLVG